MNFSRPDEKKSGLVHRPLAKVVHQPSACREVEKLEEVVHMRLETNGIDGQGLVQRHDRNALATHRSGAVVSHAERWDTPEARGAGE